MHARVHVHSCKQSPHRTSASSVSRSTYIAVLAPCISLSFDDPWFSDSEAAWSSRRMELTAFVSQHLAELFSTRDQPPKRPAPRRRNLTKSHLLRWAWTVASPLSSHRAPGTNTGQLADRKLQACSSRFKCDIALNNLLGSISRTFSTFHSPKHHRNSCFSCNQCILTQTPGVQTRRHQKYRLLQSDSNTPRHRRPLWAHRVAATNHFEQLATPGAAFSIGCWDFFPQ